jgi:hypothetical protein
MQFQRELEKEERRRLKAEEDRLKKEEDRLKKEEIERLDGEIMTPLFIINTVVAIFKIFVVWTHSINSV